MTAMNPVRKPAVAGSFYPEDKEGLRKMVLSFLEESKEEQFPGDPKAFVLPHAGYPYSGPVAATGYRAVQQRRDKIKKIILLGPSHYVPFTGLAVPSHQWFQTPLGQVPVDQDSLQKILNLPAVQSLDAAHAREHSLEVHLPFLQLCLKDFTLLPMVVSNALPKDIAKVLSTVMSEESLIIVSSDLSHFLDYKSAQKKDFSASEAIAGLKWDNLKEDQCCGYFPLRGLLQWAIDTGLQGHILDVRNSGDTAGSKSQVVGYGAYAFTRPTA